MAYCYPITRLEQLPQIKFKSFKGMANRIGATGEDVRRIFPAFTGLLALLLVFPLLAGSTERYWPTHSWRTSSPETQGFDSEALASALRTIREGNIPIHSLLLIERNGYVILDTYFFPFREREKHDLASATKSITSTLIGIAIGDGRLAGVEQPVLSVFSDRSVSYRDARKERMTISDLLTMRSGLDCRFDHGELTLNQMRASCHDGGRVRACRCRRSPVSGAQVRLFMADPRCYNRLPRVVVRSSLCR